MVEGEAGDVGSEAGDEDGEEDEDVTVTVAVVFFDNDGVTGSCGACPLLCCDDGEEEDDVCDVGSASPCASPPGPGSCIDELLGFTQKARRARMKDLPFKRDLRAAMRALRRVVMAEASDCMTDEERKRRGERKGKGKGKKEKKRDQEEAGGS